jgi:hypothetical protein
VQQDNVPDKTGSSCEHEHMDQLSDEVTYVT